jgi:hypothetical protein
MKVVNMVRQGLRVSGAALGFLIVAGGFLWGVGGRPGRDRDDFIGPADDNSDVRHNNGDPAITVVVSPSAEAQYSYLRTPGVNETRGNDILNELMASNSPRLAGELMEMAGDDRHTPRWRNYCVQHLAQHYIRHLDQTSREGLLHAARSDDQVLREIGVFSLARVCATLRLSGDDALFQDALGAIRAALAPDQPAAVRVAALRAIGVMNLPDFAPDLEAIALDDNALLEVRVAAVDVLGTLRSPGSETAVARLTRSPSRNLRAASTRALERLKPAAAGSR